MVSPGCTLPASDPIAVPVFLYHEPHPFRGVSLDEAHALRPQVAAAAPGRYVVELEDMYDTEVCELKPHPHGATLREWRVAIINRLRRSRRHNSNEDNQ